MANKHLIPLQVKILTSPVDRCKYVVARHPRDVAGGYSYHYYPIGKNDETPELDATKAIRRFLGLPENAKNLESFYDEIWDGTVDVKAAQRKYA